MTTPTHIFSRCIFVYMVIIVIFNHIDILLCCLFTYTIAETCVFCRYRARVCIAILNVIKERVKCWVRIDRRDWPVTENETVVVDSPPSMPKHDHAWRIKNPLQGPILSTWLSLNPPYKVWDGITYPFTNPIGCTVEVCWSLWMDK